MEKYNPPSVLEKMFGRLRIGLFEAAGARIERRIIPMGNVNKVAEGSLATYITDGPGDTVKISYLDPEEGSYRRVLAPGEVRVAIFSRN